MLVPVFGQGRALCALTGNQIDARHVEDVAVLIDPPKHLRTPLVESFQAVVWHALVSHPELAAREGHWEMLSARAGT